VRLAIINGRMSPRSAARYTRFRWLAQRLFGHLDLVAAQSEEYRRHFESLGAMRAVTTGNVKYDGVQGNRDNPRTGAMRELFGIRPAEIVWVAGSTQDPEERVCLDIYAKARKSCPNLRLVIVPRHRERFDEVAVLLERSCLPFARRSGLRAGIAVPPGAVILGDSMGELGAIWGLADIAYVGGSLDGKRGGQNMIEPAAYGAAVLFGPHTWNFKDTVTSLLKQGAAIEVRDDAAMAAEVERLISDRARREQLGEAARRFVLSQQGATARTLDLLAELMQGGEVAKAA
jgi:3-deoxy-D-manno-octulosonic-acid transferase